MTNFLSKTINLIKKLINKYRLFTGGLPLNTFSASIAYFLTIILLPLTEIVNKMLELLNIKEGTNYQTNILVEIIYLFSLIWVTSKLINIIEQVTVKIFETYKPKIKVRIFAFFKMFLLLFIVVLSVFFIKFLDEVIIFYINQKLVYLNDVISVILIDFLFGYVFSIFIFYVLYRLIIPIKIKNSDLFYVSIMMVILSKILFIVFDVNLFKDNLSFYYLKSFFILYYLSYLFVISLLYLKKKYLPYEINE